MFRSKLPRLESPAPTPRLQRRAWKRAALPAALITALAGTLAFHPAPANGPQSASVPPAQMAQVPLRFERNQGQSAATAQYLARSSGSVVFLTAQGAVVKLPTTAVAMRFAGGRAVRQPQGLERAAGSVTYLTGHRAFSVASFQRVRYAGVYPGVDVVYYGRAGRLEYDLRLAPGADAQRLGLKFRGATPAINTRGDLQVGSALTLRRPLAYQIVNGKRRAVGVRYILGAGHRVGFAVSHYDHSRQLVIDPVLVFSTYLGGTGFNQANAVATDTAGDAFVAGYTLSADFPTVAGSYSTAYNAGNADAFVAEIAADGKSLVYSTYLGGTMDDEATGIAVDASGNAYVSGFTDSPDFPVTAGSFQAANGGGYDGFVAKLNPAGTALVYSTYLGGSQDDKANAVAIDSSGDAFVGGFTSSANFPVTGGAPQTTLSGLIDGFATALNPAGTALLYSTQIGGDAVTRVNAIAVGATGNAYVGGTTSSTTAFPVTPGALQASNAGKFDGFVAEVDRSGRSFDYATYVGGTQADTVNGIAVDAAGYAFVTGSTDSTNIFTNPSFQTQLSGRQNAFVAELTPDGSAYQYASYLGGSASDSGNAITLDSTDNAYVAGTTSSTDLNTVAPYQTQNGGNNDAFLAKVAPSGNSLLYLTYFGGNANDSGNGVAINANGEIIVGGNTSSSNLAVTTGVLQTSLNSSNDVFVAKFAAAAQGSFSPTVLGFAAQATGVASTAETAVFTNTGEKPLDISGITTTGPYSQTNACPATLQPSDNCKISVVFTPTAAGAQDGTLVVADNGPGGSQTLPLQGTGGNFTLSINPTSNTITAGQSASYQVVVTPAVGDKDVVALSCTGNPLPPNSTCVASPTSLTMNGSTAASATITVTTTVRPAMIPPGPSLPAGPWTWLALAGLGMGMLGAGYAAVNRGRRRQLGWAGMALLLGWALAAAACGGSTTNPGTTAGNYTLTITGAAGSVKQSQTATLTVD